MEVNCLQEKILQNSPSDLSSHRHTVFLSPIEYANFMGIENSLKSELEEILEDPNQLCPSTINNNDEQLTKIKKFYRRRIKRDQSETDGESTMNDSAFSDTESLSRYLNVFEKMRLYICYLLLSALSCPYCHRCSSTPPPLSDLKYACENLILILSINLIDRSSSNYQIENRITTGISSRLRLVKRLEG